MVSTAANQCMRPHEDVGGCESRVIKGRRVYQEEVLRGIENGVKWYHNWQCTCTAAIMANLRESGEVEGPFPDDEPVDRLVVFYMANGYELVEREADSPARASLERGEAGAGWWTSDMTKLHTRVHLERHAERVEVVYEVDTSGQVLNDIEEAFWRRELQAARRYCRGEVDEPRDMREQEANRAAKQKSSLMSFGLWGAVAVFLIVVLLGFLGLL